MLRSETCALVSILTFLRPFRGGADYRVPRRNTLIPWVLAHGLQIDTSAESARRRATNMNSHHASAWSDLSLPLVPPLPA